MPNTTKKFILQIDSLLICVTVKLKKWNCDFCVFGRQKNFILKRFAFQDK